MIEDHKNYLIDKAYIFYKSVTYYKHICIFAFIILQEVRIGLTDSSQSMSVELDDNFGTTVTGSNQGGGTSGLLSSSPPGPPLTPPSSPNVQVRDLVWEPLELQLDYWQVIKNTDSNKNRPDGKNSLKGSFRSIFVCRTPGSTNLSLTVNFASKEKKQKIMRLGKKKEKDKENEAKNQTIEGISRLICSAKPSHNAPLKGMFYVNFYLP